jgi:hypothetical protein
MAGTSDNDNDNDEATTLALRAAFYAGVGSTEEEMDVQVVVCVCAMFFSSIRPPFPTLPLPSPFPPILPVLIIILSSYPPFKRPTFRLTFLPSAFPPNIKDYLVSMLIEDDLDDEDAWGALEGYLPDNNGRVKEESVGALRHALKDITNAKAKEEEAAAVRRRELARAAAEAAASGNDGDVRTGEEEEEEGVEEEEETEEVLTEAQLLDLAFLCDLLGEGGVEEEEEESNGKATAASKKKSTSSPSSSSYSSTATVPFPRDLLKYVYLIKCGKTRQRAAEVLVTSASEEGIASLREEQVVWREGGREGESSRLSTYSSGGLGSLRLSYRSTNNFLFYLSLTHTHTHKHLPSPPPPPPFTKGTSPPIPGHRPRHPPP